MERYSEARHDIKNPYMQLAASMRQELVGLPPLSNSCCIYRVPEELRRVNQRAYTPQVVSIGPLHHGTEDLKDMEEHKKRYLKYFLDRTLISLEVCVKTIKDKEAELRSCYAHTIGLCSVEFVRIVLVDAAFIIEFLLRYRYIILDGVESNDPDPIFNKPWLIKFIVPDMFLLENQLPFFILEDLFATAKVPGSVFDLSYKFCKKTTSLYVDRCNLGSSSRIEVEHFVDLIRTLNLPTEGERGSIETLTVPSMTKLRQAGVKFKVRPSNNLFDICFKDGILEIPHLIIEDNTEPLLRNLIAFEQCHCSPNTYFFCDYSRLVDYLVNTPNDVELLVKNGIVENMLGDNNEVSTLINSLGKGVMLDTRVSYYATLTKGLNKYYKKPWNKWKADLNQQYFNSPWTIISVIAATFLIILTLIQTVYSSSQCTQR